MSPRPLPYGSHAQFAGSHLARKRPGNGQPLFAILSAAQIGLNMDYRLPGRTGLNVSVLGRHDNRDQTA